MELEVDGVDPAIRDEVQDRIAAYLVDSEELEEAFLQRAEDGREDARYGERARFAATVLGEESAGIYRIEDRYTFADGAQMIHEIVYNQRNDAVAVKDELWHECFDERGQLGERVYVELLSDVRDKEESPVYRCKEHKNAWKIFVERMFEEAVREKAAEVEEGLLESVLEDIEE